ncbi:MAG: twin-arginine translocation signal domain-containing protein [Deltaproteobacteria bacterium]|nr:twin-arginine translocation signal domain-containing protein [Deltaproteobacteria bacterium]
MSNGPKTDEISRRDFLGRAGVAAAGLMASFSTGCQKEAEQDKGAQKKAQPEFKPSELLQRWESEFAAEGKAIWQAERWSMYSASAAAQERIFEALSNPDVRAVLDAARVDGSGNALDLRTVEENYGLQTRRDVAALLQHGINRAISDILKRHPEFSERLDEPYVPIPVDGDFGKRSHLARHTYHSLLSAEHEKEVGRPLAIPRRPGSDRSLETRLGYQAVASLDRLVPELLLATKNAETFGIFKDTAAMRGDFKAISLGREHHSPIRVSSPEIQAAVYASLKTTPLPAGESIKMTELSNILARQLQANSLHHNAWEAGGEVVIGCETVRALLEKSLH